MIKPLSLEKLLKNSALCVRVQSAYVPPQVGEGTKARVNKTQWRIQTQEQQLHNKQTAQQREIPPKFNTENTWSQTKESKMIIYPPYSDSGSGVINASRCREDTRLDHPGEACKS